MVESLRTKDKSPFFLRLRVYKTTGLRVFSFELELRIHGTASIGKSQTATAPDRCLLSVVRSLTKQTAGNRPSCGLVDS